MTRHNGKAVPEIFVHKHKIRSSGEMAAKGSYVCLHCNSHLAMEHSGYLPLCRACYGRRFKQL